MASRAASVTGLPNRNRNRASVHIIHIPHQQQPPRDDFQSSTPWYVVFIFVIPVLEVVVQAHFYDSSPFEKHPINMWTFLLALLTYCIALGYYVKFWLTGSKNFKNICNQVGYVSGSLTSAALVSNLVPPSCESFVLVIWMVTSTMFVDVTRNKILRVFRKFCEIAKDAVSYVHNTWKWITRNDGNVEASTVPL